MKVEYEWIVETMEDGEVVDVNHWSTYAEAADFAAPGDKIGLVCDLWDDDYGGSDRSWAYITDGRLPEQFADAYGAHIRKVPQRFHRELK